MKLSDSRTLLGTTPNLGGWSLTENPLDQIAGEHLHEREVCAALDQLAQSAPSDPDPDEIRGLAAEVLRHLTTWLPLHIRDEEDDLFPLLRRRSEPGDDINDTLDRLKRDHSHSVDLAGQVQRILHTMVETGAGPSGEMAAVLAGFAAHERRHLIVENAIVLPLARVRLTAQDLALLSGRIMERRSAETPGGPLDGD